MDKQQLQILQHALGVGDYGDKESHRNHFVSGEGGSDHKACLSLVDLGLMRVHVMSKGLTGGDDCFTVTPKGIDYVALNSPMRPPEPKMTRGQKRYREYQLSECCESFAEWMGFKNRFSR